SERRSRDLIYRLLHLFESALIELERRKILREAQFISLIGFGDDSVILKDVRKDGKLIEAQIRSKNLKCLHYDSSECIHVGVCLGLTRGQEGIK
ncbi:MAG: hypothetical protein WA667_01710, partial [Candidatus Nitrosopolaris sp.]